MSWAAWKRHSPASTTQGMGGQERRHFPTTECLWSWEMGLGPGTKHQHDLLERFNLVCCCPSLCASSWENHSPMEQFGGDVMTVALLQLRPSFPWLPAP